MPFKAHNAPAGRRSSGRRLYGLLKPKFKMYCKIIDVHAFHGSSDLKPLVVRFTASLFHGTTYLLEQYGMQNSIADNADMPAGRTDKAALVPEAAVPGQPCVWRRTLARAGPCPAHCRCPKQHVAEFQQACILLSRPTCTFLTFAHAYRWGTRPPLSHLCPLEGLAPCCAT
jgi:hypothetical protein